MIVEEFINYYEVDHLDFQKYIRSIGFIYDFIYDRYYYKEYRIFLNSDNYDFYNGSKWIYTIVLNDLSPLIKFDRSYKLKKILG